MDYNKLMAELDKTLGLEKSATESIKPKKSVKPVYEGYDEVEAELARDLGIKLEEKRPSRKVRVAKESAEEDLFLDGEETSVVSPEGPEEELSPEDILRESIAAYVNQFDEEAEAEEIKEKLIEIVEEVVCPEGECETEEVKTADESLEGSKKSFIILEDEDSGYPIEVVCCNPGESKKVLAEIETYGYFVKKVANPKEGKYLFISNHYGGEGRLLYLGDREMSSRYAGEPHVLLDLVNEKVIDYDFVVGAEFMSAEKFIASLEGEASSEDEKEDYLRWLAEDCYKNGYSYNFKNFKDCCREDDITGITKADFNRYLELLDEVRAEKSEEAAATEGSLTDKLLAMGGAHEEPAEEAVTPEAEAVSEPVEEDPEAAFESLKAKMLSRYSELSRNSHKGGSATEGKGDGRVSLDERAIARTSCEFGYSGNKLRKIVTEAIGKGVI